MYIAPGKGQTAPRGQSFDVNRNICCQFQIIDDNISEKYIVLPFSHTKAKGTKFEFAVK